MLDTRPHNIVRNRATAERERGEDWREQAVCRDKSVDPEWWFSFKGHERALAKQICATCPVKNKCREIAVGEQWGIWAGEDKTRLPKYPTCDGGCGKNLRPRGTLAAEHPGTIVTYTPGYCAPCWKNAPTDVRQRNKPLPECLGCGRKLRPNKIPASKRPGTVRAEARGYCAPCNKKRNKK